MMALRPFDETDVDLEFGHRGDDFAGVADSQPDRMLRIGLSPAGDVRRQQILADREAGADSQAGALLGLEQVLQIPRLLEQGLGARQQSPAVLVENETAADPVEDRCTERGLQIGERAAGRRLRAGDLFGRRPRATRPGGGHEYRQLAQRQPGGRQAFAGAFGQERGPGGRLRADRVIRVIDFSGHIEQYYPLILFSREA